MAAVNQTPCGIVIQYEKCGEQVRPLRHNLAANVVGNGCLAAANIAVVPLYVKALGIEAYGLVGLYGILQAVFSSLDFGMTATLTREASRSSVDVKSGGLPGLFIAIERIFLAIALLAGILVAVASPQMADHWVHVIGLSRHTVAISVAYMAVSISARFLVTLYSSALTGLQDHVILNCAKVFFELVRLFGALGVLALFPRGVAEFFIYQGVILIVFAVTLRRLLGRQLPLRSAIPDFKGLRNISQFAAGMYGISLTTILLMQMDKFLVSKLLTLRELGYYSVACALAFGVYQVISPISTSIYPRLATLVRSGTREELNRVFHLGAQLLVCTAVPTGILIAEFSRTILTTWIHNAIVADAAQIPLELLAIGMCLNAMMNLPYSLQLAYGWTSLTLAANITSLGLFAPALLLCIREFGIVGAAVGWPIVNLLYIAVIPHLLFRRYLVGEKVRWYIQDCATPACAAAGVATVARIVLPSEMEGIKGFAMIGLTFLIMVTAAVAVAPAVRQVLLGALRLRVPRAAL